MTDIQDRIDVSTEINHLFPFSSPEGTPPTTPANAAWIQSRFFTAEIPTNGQTFAWSASQNKWIYTMGEAGAGDATSLRGRLITTDAPGDSDSLKWSTSENKWIYVPIDSGDAISLRSRLITTDAPDELDVLQWTGLGGWGYVPESTLRDALTIQGRALPVAAPDDLAVPIWSEDLSSWAYVSAVTLRDALSIQGGAVTASAPNDLDVLQWSADDSEWIAAPMSGGGGAIDFVAGKAYALQSIDGLNDFRADRGGVIGERNVVYGGAFMGITGSVFVIGGGPAAWIPIIGFDPANVIGDPDEIAPLLFCQVTGGGNVVDPAGADYMGFVEVWGAQNTVLNCSETKVWGSSNLIENAIAVWLWGSGITAGPGLENSFIFAPESGNTVVSAGSNIVFADFSEIGSDGRALIVGSGINTYENCNGSAVFGWAHRIGVDSSGYMAFGGTPGSLIFGQGNRTLDFDEIGYLYVGGANNQVDHSPFSKVHGSENRVFAAPFSEVFGIANDLGISTPSMEYGRIWGHDNVVNDTISLFGFNSVWGWNNDVDGMGALVNGMGNTIRAGSMGASVFGNLNDYFGVATLIVGQLCLVDGSQWSGLFGESISLTNSENSWFFGDSITGADCHFSGALGTGIDIGGTCNFAAGYGHLVRGAGNIVAGQENQVDDFKTGEPEANAVFGGENMVGGVDSIVAGRKHSVVDTVGKIALFGYGHEAAGGTEFGLWFGKEVTNGWYSSFMHGTGKDALGNWVGQNFPEVALWGKTTDATETELFLDGPGGHEVLTTGNWGENGAYFIEVMILAHRTDVRGQVKIWKQVLVVTEDPGSAALVVLNPSMSSVWSTSLGNESSWDFEIDWQTLPVDYIRFLATGYAGETIHWQVSIRGVHAIQGAYYVP